MKKILKIFLYSILIIIVGGFIFFYIYYQSYSPERDDIDINKEDLVYFQETYDESRNSFLADVAEVKQIFRNVESSEFKVESNIDTSLFIDLCYIPPQQNTSRLLILISGTHGVEGYTGSAIQQMFMTELLNEELVSDMGILFVHAFNPYGFKYISYTIKNEFFL